MKKGKVWLVGAGPSDFELLTIKGKKIIEKADVILYDRLVSHSIISLANDNALTIDVGKCSNNHTMPQEEINKLLLKYALEGKQVVRLKGGDPFLFGRGGEELELLVENDIDFEVVNGITSAISVPAYNGIPVTHRDFVSSLHIITGHTKDNSSNIDFKSLVKLNGTLVFLMGVSSLKIICDGLIDAGMDKNMPVCILEKGTTANQRNIKATLSTIYEKSIKEKAKTPAIIIVGKVCSLSEKFDWKNRLPLSKTRVLVTRPKDINFTFCDMLRNNGAEVIDLPTIKTVPIQNKDIEETFNSLDYNYIVFTSPKGVEQFFYNMKLYKKDIRCLFNKKIAVVGKATKKAVEEKGLFIDIMPQNYSGKDLGYELLKYVNDNDKILIARAKEGNVDILNVLNSKNIIVKDLGIYETKYEKAKFVNFEFNYDDIVTFTSASTVIGFVNSVADFNLDYTKIKAICIGKQTEEEAKKYNFKTYVSNQPTLDSLLEKVIELAKKEI
ncbi:uroporphyrinogen-III C-methyltransferase [[Clostridium] colinum]|uniref:uroporphyrinogen-III C-methyltransferase n=1 Tax=[Clostridium] colinum TaxID=36835 RepID=UPI002024B746|nr:uroporphyrinogen-III C-methyltransferase [[Clostridium] colinum]